MFVQGIVSADNASGVSGASLSGVAAGHGLACFVIYNNSSPGSPTLTDSSGTTWALLKSLGITGGTLSVYTPSSSVGAGTHTVTASFTGGGTASTVLIEDDQAVISGPAFGQTLTTPGAGNTLVPGHTVGVSGSSVYQLAIDVLNNGITFRPRAGAYQQVLFSFSEPVIGAWSVANSPTALGGTNSGMAPGLGDATGGDNYGVLAMAFAPGGATALRMDQVVLVEEPTVYFRSPDYAGSLFNRTYPVVITTPFFALQSSRPAWPFFESPFVSVYPVIEAFSPSATQPKANQLVTFQKASRRLEEPEDEYKRWNHAVYWQYVRLYAAQLVGYTFTVPDLCDHPWLEWVHPPASPESAIYPFRQISSFIRGQQFNLFFNQPKPWLVEGEADTVDRKINYGIMLPWPRPAIAVIMPNVIGFSVADATTAIEGLGNLPAPNVTFQSALYQQPPYAPGAALVGQLPAPPPVPAGIVIGQFPAAGAQIQFPFFTLLIVSTGLVTLPGQGASTNYSPVNIVIADDTPP